MAGLAYFFLMQFYFAPRFLRGLLLPSLAGLGLLVPCPARCAASSTEAVRVIEGGVEREFRVALDELALPGASPRILSFAPLASAKDVRTHATAQAARHGAEPVLVLYPKEGPRTEANRRLLTRDVVVRLTADADPEALAFVAGADSVTPVADLPGWHRVQAARANDAGELAVKLAAQPFVTEVLPQLARPHARKLVPNDTDFWQLWHLRNTGQNLGTAGMDIRVTNVWDQYRGQGVVIGLVDDGIQGEHPDLAANYSAALSTNLNVGAFNPWYDDHGTRVAGTAAARGDNGIGVTGAAYESTLASIRLLSEYTTDETDAQAMLHRNDVIQVKNNSWGAWDSDGSYPSELDGPGPLMAEALVTGTSTGRGGLGTVYVFSGGNGRATDENVNNDGYANGVRVIAVGAVSDRGEQSSFSEPGACLTVVAPSGSGAEICRGGRQRILTTDLLGNDGQNWQFAYCEPSNRDYTQNFTGTSAAAPLVSGVVALLLQANPLLGWRDVKEILLRSATRVQPTDPEWVTNSAGIAHNPKFGGGLVNASNAVHLASTWANLGPMTTLAVVQTNLALPVPDNDPTGVSRSFTFSTAGFRVEHARLTLWLPHQKYGDLKVTLTSPGGITSVLTDLHNTDGPGYVGWSFSSVRHWGESAAGTWTLTVVDRRAGMTGTLEAATLELLGTGTAFQITGQVQLQGFTGPRIGGVAQGGTRAVTFVATSNYFNGVTTVTNVLKSWTNLLSFSGTGVASYTLADAPPTTMFLSAKTAWNLRKKMAVTWIASSATVNFTSTTLLPGGDLDGSNRVLTPDYSLLRVNWLQTTPAADIDGSGLVTTPDYSILRVNWLRAGDAQ